MRHIEKVSISSKDNLKDMLNEYLMQLSEYDTDVKFDDSGSPIYKWFDCYFTDKDRYPLYLIIDGEPAGFALVRQLSDKVYEIAEFYVKPEHRKDDNSLYLANEVISLFSGDFEFSTKLNNKRAVKFWTKFVSNFENSIYSDDDKCRHWKIKI